MAVLSPDHFETCGNILETFLKMHWGQVWHEKWAKVAMGQGPSILIYPKFDQGFRNSGTIKHCLDNETLFRRSG